MRLSKLASVGIVGLLTAASYAAADSWGRSVAVPVRRSLAPSGPAPARSSGPAATLLFADDFEAGLEGWEIDGDWVTVTEGANRALEGQGHAWAAVRQGSSWTDYEVRARVQVFSGAVQVMVRLNQDRGRYIIGLHRGGVYLRREAPWESITGDLASDSTSIEYGTWHTLSVAVEGRRIRVRVDGTQRLEHTDASARIIWLGTLGLEVVGSGPSRARFDDVEVLGIANPERAWVKTGGPIGGLGYDVRYGLPDTEVLYVTDNYSGVNKSLDGGRTWFATNRGITGRFGASGDAIPVFSLTVDRNDATNLWAGLKDVKGVYRSIDAGRTWSAVTPNVPEEQFVFRGFTIMPGDSDVVFAAGEIPTALLGKSFGKVRGRVYRTNDGGEQWTPIWEGDNLARYVIVDPTDHSVLYVSTGIFDREAYNSDCSGDIAGEASRRGGLGVLKGKYDGTSYSWTRLDGAHGLSDLYVGSLVMHPTDPAVLLAGTGNNACSTYWEGEQWRSTGGVFLTTNGGLTWSHTLTNDTITAVEFSPSKPRIAYAGSQNHFYASQDGGDSWAMVAGADYPWGPPGVAAGFPIDLVVDPDDPLTVFANNYGGGNVVSADGGVSWRIASQGYTGALMFDVAVDPGNPATVYAAARSGAFRSRSGGAAWEGLARSPADLSTAYAIAVKPDDPRVLLASHELLGYVYRSSDAGASWRQVFQIPGIVPGEAGGDYGFRRIRFAPSDPRIVYAGSCRGSVALQAGSSGGRGVYVSDDGGLTWRSASDASGIAAQCVTDVAIDPTSAQTAYAATAATGVFRTDDGGLSWRPLPGLPRNVRAIAVEPGRPEVVYAGTRGSGVYRSERGGRDWTPLVPGMEPNDSISAIAFNPRSPAEVWAASLRTGVYRWHPDEGLWTHANAGLRTRSVADLAFAGDGSVLYAATIGEGVFRLGEVSVVPTATPEATPSASATPAVPTATRSSTAQPEPTTTLAPTATDVRTATPRPGTATATSAATATATASETVGTPAALCENVLPEGHFESGIRPPWEAVGEVDVTSLRAHGGERSVALGGAEGSEGEVFASLVLPPDATAAELTAWWYVESADSDPSADVLTIVVESPGLPTDILGQVTNLSPRGAWHPVAFDMRPYAGRFLGLTFHAQNNADKPTTFYVDDVAMTWCGWTRPATVFLPRTLRP